MRRTLLWQWLMTSFVNPDYFRSLKKIHFVISNFFLLIQNGVGDPLNTPSPPLLATKHNSVEIVYISYKNFLYFLDKSAVKIDRRILFPNTHVRLAISSSSFCFCLFVFLIPTRILPLYTPNRWRKPLRHKERSHPFRIWIKGQTSFIARVLWRPFWIFNTRACSASARSGTKITEIAWSLLGDLINWLYYFRWAIGSSENLRALSPSWGAR